MKKSTICTIGLIFLALIPSCKSHEKKSDQQENNSEASKEAAASPVAALDEHEEIASAPVEERKDIIIAVSGKMPSSDPRNAKELASMSLSSYVFEGLNHASEEIHVLPDQRVYTFTLRKAEWSDGSPITAHDFIASWKATLDPKARHPNAYHLFVIENAKEAGSGKLPLDAVGIEALDERTLVVKLTQPQAHFLEIIATPPFFAMPQKSLLQDSEEPLISNGRYLIEKITPEEIVLQKNPRYWNKDNVTFDTLKLQRFDEATALNKFQNGEIDFLGAPFFQLSRTASEALGLEKRLESTTGAAVQLIRINVNSPLFSDIKMRQALSKAIVRSQLVKESENMPVETASQFVPPCFQLETTTRIEENIEKARELFHEALFENQLLKETIPQISLTFQKNERNQKLAETLARQWKEALDIDVTLDPIIAKSAFYQKLFRNDYQLILGSWMADSKDPMLFLAPFQCRTNSSNATGWENKEYASLISKASTTQNPEERQKLLAQAEAILLQEMPLIPLVFCDYNFAKSTRLQQASVTPFGALRLN